jgi:hypothetical protein
MYHQAESPLKAFQSGKSKQWILPSRTFSTTPHQIKPLLQTVTAQRRKASKEMPQTSNDNSGD